MTDMTTSAVVYSKNGRIYSGMNKEDLRRRPIGESDKTIKKIEKAFDFADGLGESGIKDGIISEEELAAYDKEMKKKKIKNGLIIAGTVAFTALRAYLFHKGLNSAKFKNPGHELIFQQGDKQITQLWKEGEKSCDLVEHAIFEKGASGLTKSTQLSFEKDTLKTFHEVTCKDADIGFRRFEAKGSSIANVNSLADSAVCEGNAFEKLANESLKSPSRLRVSMGDGPQGAAVLKGEGMTELTKMFSGKAITESSEATDLISSKAKKIDTNLLKRIKNIGGKAAMAAAMIGSAVITVLGYILIGGMFF